MTRPTIPKLLAIAALVLLAASPTSALAAKQQKTAFHILIKGVGQYDPVNPAYYDYEFKAWGAISDSGTLGAGGNSYSTLLGKETTYVVFFDWQEGTFQIWQPTDATWPGDLLGTGTFTRESTSNGGWVRDRLELDGALIGA